MASPTDPENSKKSGNSGQPRKRDLYNPLKVQPRNPQPAATPARELTPAARRALKEAQDRAIDRSQQQPAEVGGRDGPEPTRYGDWEKNGIISDF